MKNQNLKVVNTPSQNLVYGVGITDIKTVKDNSHSYSLWKAMLSRCYSDYVHKTRPTYIGCEVCEEWKTYSNFKAWYDKNYREDCQLDKDLLVPNNKVYSPRTCEFIPHELNSIIASKPKTKTGFTGVTLTKNNRYRASIRINGRLIHLGTFDYAMDAYQEYVKAKKEIIEETALKYYKQGMISTRLFKALINYKM